MSLQRRRERYTIIHVWKIHHGLAPNDIRMEFYTNDRLGLRVRVPKFNNRAQRSTSSAYEDSFAVNGARLWNILPKTVNTQTTLDGLKRALGIFIDQYPDYPPYRATPLLTTTPSSRGDHHEGLKVDAHDAVLQCNLRRTYSNVSNVSNVSIVK